ncbi:MAG: helix-turn-helix transcriptional regulator [Mucilaginibacter sp.]
MDKEFLLHNNNRILFNKTRKGIKSDVNENLSFHFVFEGEEKFKLKKRTMAVLPGSFLSLNAGTPYLNIIDSLEPTITLSIIFGKDFVNSFRNAWLRNDNWLLDNLNGEAASQINETIYPLNGDIRYTVNHLNREISSETPDYLLLDEYLYHSLLNYHTMCEKEIYCRREKLKLLQKATRNEIYRRLNLAKEYLYSNYNQNVTLDELAAYACMSVNYLMTMFKQAFTLTPHQYLIRIRLQKAKLYLDQSTYPVNEIVNIIGLTCPSSFIELFRQKYGITPQQYRENRTN